MELSIEKPQAVVVALASILLAIPVAAQVPSSDKIVVTSAASYKESIAPDSLATVFGSNLAVRTAPTEVDSRGNLLTELAGTSIEVNGRRSALVSVSPAQINFHVPPETDLGTAEVIVRRAGLGIVGRGAVTVENSAPALFSLDASGGGKGAIINGVTFKLEPFDVSTQENPGSDKRTRLSLFATGLRLAGNPQRGLEVTNVAPSVTVDARDSAGKVWSLEVEYAGSAPGFFGLDQVNVVLPSELGGVGTLAVTVSAEQTSSSNTVTCVIRSSQPPQIESFAPTNVPPGGELTVRGRGFAEDTDSSSRRNIVILEVAGKEYPFLPSKVSASSITALVMPIVQDSQGSWYRGPARLCVGVDGRKQCATQLLSITEPLRSPQPDGALLLEFAQRSTSLSIEALRLLGRDELAAQIAALGATNLAELKALIADALAGRPRTFTVDLGVGQTATASFDVATIRQTESLIAAYQTSIDQAFGTVEAQVSQLRLRSSAPQCPFPDEQAKVSAKMLHDTLEVANKVAATIKLGVALTGYLGCVKAKLLSVATCTAIAKPGFIIGAVALIADFGTLLGQVGLELLPNNLAAFEAQPSSFDLKPSEQAEFKVYGLFRGISSETAGRKIASAALQKVFFGAFSKIIAEAESDFPTAGLLEQLIDSAIGWVIAVLEPKVRTPDIPPKALGNSR